MKPADKTPIPLTEMDSIEQLFRKYYDFVCRSVYTILRDRNKTEDVAQEVFTELWLKRNQIEIHTSVQAYLRRMAITRALNFIRDSKRHQWDTIDDPDTPIMPSVGPDILLTMQEAELQQKINQAIRQLPDKCRVIFLLSREEQLSYAEIAEQLDISVKTVENQVGKALRLLREAVLSDRG